MPREPSNARKPRVTQPENQDILSFPVIGISLGIVAIHLSLSVESPKRTSIMVMIQKRTTTWFSFQPFNS